MSTFPTTTPTTQVAAQSLMVNAATTAGLPNSNGFDLITYVCAIVGNMLASMPGTALRPDIITVITYSATMATNAALGNYFRITASDTVAMTISNPTNPTTGQTITYELRNGGGGTMGTITWGNAFKTGTFTKPANGTCRTVSFIYDGTNWVGTNYSGVDVTY